MTAFINFYGGPSAGKSTAAAAMFAEAKRRGHSAEMVPEFAKIAVWEGRPITLGAQILFLGQQIQREEHLAGKVDYVFCDGPAGLVALYTDLKGRSSGGVELATEHTLRLLEAGHVVRNFFVQRRHAFVGEGRIHSEKESLDLDDLIRDVVKTEPLPESPWPF